MSDEPHDDAATPTEATTTPDEAAPDATAERTDADASDAADAATIDPAVLDSLAGQLIWRIGRTGEDGPVTVRVGLASSASAFADLPKLRSASDSELRDAVEADALRVEWVGSGR